MPGDGSFGDERFEGALFADAAPLLDGGVEAAGSSIKLIVATAGGFVVEGRERTAFAVGPRTGPVAVRYRPGSACREWVLPAWMAEPVFGPGGPELARGIVDLVDLPDSPFVRAARRAAEGDEAGAVGPALRAALRARGRARPRSSARLVAEAWRALDGARGRNPVRDVAATLGVGVRRLEQAVRSATGLRPSDLVRLLRFERAVARLERGDAGLAAVAQRAGYSDQSHMSRDFVAFAAAPPGELRVALRRRSADAGRTPP